MSEQFESSSDPVRRAEEPAADVPEDDASQPDSAACDSPAEAMESAAQSDPDQSLPVSQELEQPQPRTSTGDELAEPPGDIAAEVTGEQGDGSPAPQAETVAERVTGDEQQPPEPPTQPDKADSAEVAAGQATETDKATDKADEEQEEQEEPKSDKMDWYILKVQSNREDSIAAGLRRRIKIAGLDYFFGKVIVPTETVTEFKGGKKRVSKRKLYPGYLVVQMEVNEETWFLVRETPGIGDFTGAGGKPTPLLPHEVDRLIARQQDKAEQSPKLKIAFSIGDRVKINEGTFENFQGEVSAIDETNGRVTVMINIFGRSTPVELEYWQVEAI